MELSILKEDVDNIIYNLITYDRFCYITKATSYRDNGSTKAIKSKYKTDVFRVFFLDTNSVLHSVKFFDNLKEAYKYYDGIRKSEKHTKFIKTDYVS